MNFKDSLNDFVIKNEMIFQSYINILMMIGFIAIIIIAFAYGRISEHTFMNYTIEMCKTVGVMV